MTVQATHYGTLALVIIAGALGIFVLTAATRAIRRARRKREPEREAEPADQPAWPDKPGEADNVVADGGEAGGHAGAHDPAEETDDYAWAPRRADRR
jgi:hypothetical protein